MNEQRNREKIHEILDLVLDANGLECRKRERTGNKPTVFFNFSGHVAGIDVGIHANGWSGEHPQETVSVGFNTDEDIPQEKIEMLRFILLAAKKED